MDEFGESGADCGDHPTDDNLLEGLTPEQLVELSHLIYDMMMRELRIEQERHGKMIVARAW